MAKSQGAMNNPEANGALAREAGIAFQPQPFNIDPFAEWLSLMEVVQMLCPAWPERIQTVRGKEWKI